MTTVVNSNRMGPSGDADSQNNMTPDSLTDESPPKCAALKRRLVVAFVVALSLVITYLCIAAIKAYGSKNEQSKSAQNFEKLPKVQAIWYEKAFVDLEKALSEERNKAKQAKNVILFVGDGMGPNTVTAARIAKYGEEGLLSWEKFSELGMLKTYCADKQVPDSMSTATALFCGVKVNYETGGVDSSVKLGDCLASLDKERHVDSIIKLAKDKGLRTGFVTTTRVMHATPAALYAHVADRRWECETRMPEEARKAGCKDIARTLIEDEPGRSINVIMGGGRQCLRSNVSGSESDPIDTWACKSADGRDLIADWAMDKKSRGLKHSIVSNNEELNKLSPEDTDYVLGIFANGHLKYDHERNKGPKGMPSLAEMTKKAVEILNFKNSDGFVLVVEAGNIDQAHHRGAARKAISETLALDVAVEETLNTLGKSLKETLVIVTSDHSHTLTINGYPDRGNSIFGIASRSKVDNIPYTTLSYGTSLSGFQIDVDNQTMKGKRRNPEQDDVTSYDYTQQSAIQTDENTHGGSDVAIYAIGPLSHLLRGIHEQSYVAHVIQFAMRLGRFSEESLLKSLADLISI